MTARDKALTIAHQQVASIKSAMNSKREEIVAIVGSDQRAQRIMMGALMIASDNDKVRECTPASVVKASMQAALADADVSAGVGEGYLVPYRNKDTGLQECQFMPGYRLGQRKSQEATGLRVVADTVYTKDKWDCSNIPMRLSHAPGFPERGEFVLAYAAALDKAGNVVMFQLASKDDVENAIAAGSKGKGPGPAWRTWFDRMARKVPIMRLAKEMRGLCPEGKTSRIDNVLDAEAKYWASAGEVEAPRAAGMLTEGKQRFGFNTAEAGRAAVEPEKVEARPKTEKKAKGKKAPEPKPDKEAPKDSQWDNVGPPPVGEAQDADFDPVTGEVDVGF